MKRNTWSTWSFMLLLGITTLGVTAVDAVYSPAVKAAVIPIIKEGDGQSSKGQEGRIMGNVVDVETGTTASNYATTKADSSDKSKGSKAKTEAIKTDSKEKSQGAKAKNDASKSNSTVSKSESSKSTASKSNSTVAKNVKTVNSPAYNTNEDTKIPNIRVLLGGRTTPLTVTGNGEISVYNEDKKPFQRVTTGQAVVVGLKKNKLTINGKAVEGEIYLKSWQGKTSTIVKVDGKPYRGAVKIVPTSNGSMLVINETSLESYLYGVVPAEAVPSWPQEALKAQAVAARTYALYNMNQSVSKPYDVKPTTSHQVYSGQAGEYDSTTRAVDATKGMVMKYKGALIEAFFHSDGGGFTEDSVNVWGSVVPYLKGVKDYSNNSNTSAWTVNLTRSALENKLKAAGKDVGTLKEIKLSTLRKRPIKASDRGVSGRVLNATFVGSKKSLTLSGDTIMKMLGLKSTLFDFYVNVKPPATADSFKSPKAYHTFKKANDTVYIRGYGWGHGLGMSQWGAAAMAQKAGNSKDYYKTILTHYYSGITIDKIY
ncbi:SpoIID/LytB domain-containing protein [uncultured Veillonella sp.]|uniref:SpoIID/LytB domain-containing protein n=1 Tax=uncultured Veillonella sp. TaxID=159268 RepID=UPI0025D2775D|nr:SpoIID/LytB domain-containing protein [uncultured Veillonella sp.]